VWAALGLVFVWESIAAMVGTQAVKLGKQTLNLPTRRSWAVASPILALALIPLFANWSSATRNGDTTTRDFAHDLLNSVEPYGILVTVGDNDTFPLWYAQEVEGIRRDVVIANTSLLNTDWYVRQIIRSPIRDYDPAKGPAIYRDKQWPKPANPPLRLTLDEADQIPLAQENRDTVLFTVGKIKAVIQPRIFTKADYAVLLMIRDNPDRPIYFARTSGGYGHELGFGPYLVMQGLARKLLPDIPTPTRDTLLVPGEGWVDLPRSTALWNEIFEGHTALEKKGGWPDRASVGIPALYVNTGLILSEALENLGDRAKANEVMKKTEGVARATRIDEFFSFVNQRSAVPLPAGDSAPRLSVPSSLPPGKKDTGN
jgi:energy-coupling factor transporter transmembrane protein EcfT